MHRIAICDDEKFICNQIEKMISNYFKNNLEKIDIEVFYLAEELYSFIENYHGFDLIFLDIELGELSGVELGRLIREELKDDLTQIVYISYNQGYSMDLFENRPLNFLIKPLNEDVVIKSLQKSMELFRNLNSYFIFKSGRCICKTPYKDIIYFKSNNKKITIIKADKNEEFYDKLSNIYKCVPSEYFVLIHKSYLINYLYVLEYRYDFIKMTNGEILSISQTYRKEVSSNLLKLRKGR